MSDRFHPISMEQLTRWAFTELEHKESLFSVPLGAVFVPDPGDRFRLRKYGYDLETPFGVAAGPQSQMAQNIVVSWLCGSRFLELKTVPTLDELDVNKPCIDIQDAGSFDHVGEKVADDLMIHGRAHHQSAVFGRI